MTSPISINSLKSCEESFNSLFVCMSQASDLNSCRAGWKGLQACSERAAEEEIAGRDEGQGQGQADRSLSGALQAALPRVFKNAEDLPRERTILADTLAKVAPHIFDPKDDDDEKDDK